MENNSGFEEGNTVKAAIETELRERVFRYEDSVNAARAAMRHGYLPGGGTALMNAYVAEDYPEPLRGMFRKYCQSNLRQIAINCGQDANTIVDRVQNLIEDLAVKDIGYDARTGDCVDMVKNGIIDPFQVVKLAVENSISAAANILSVNYHIINEQPKESEKTK